MEFLHPWDREWEYTFSDLFICPSVTDTKSRLDVDITPISPLSTKTPIISANMNSVTGKRMSEVIARVGWLWILPQDMDMDTTLRIIDFVQNADDKVDSPIIVNENHKVIDAQSLIWKRSHDAVVMVDDKNNPIRIYTSTDLKWQDDHTKLMKLRSWRNMITGYENTSNEALYDLMIQKWVDALPIIRQDWSLVWMIQKDDMVRLWIHNPNLNAKKQLNISVALGINNYKSKIDKLMLAWVDTFVLDTAHGGQINMIEAIKNVRSEVWENIQIVAWNICTWKQAQALLDAWANWLKVGIGPWAMCTTRMQTWVGRPQFSAIKECAAVANSYDDNRYVWWDGGIKEPRDMALALAAWASHVMLGTILAGTYESTGKLKEDEKGLYKESHGMASWKAVNERTQDLNAYERAKKSLFQEGISSSKVYLRDWRESVTKLVTEFTSGLRSTMTYVWAENMKEFQEKTVVGVQTNSGYHEWTPHKTLNK